MKQIRAKLPLYGVKYLNILMKLSLCCCLSSFDTLKSAVGSNASIAPTVSSSRYHPLRNSSCEYFTCPFVGSETQTLFLSAW